MSEDDRHGAPTEPRAVRTLIVDDQAAFRHAMHDLVAATPGFSDVGEACSGEDAITAVDALAPHLVVMDVRMPGIGGVEAARILSHLHPEVTVLLVSVHGDEELPRDVLAGGDGSAFASKRELRPRLLRELWERHRRR